MVKCSLVKYVLFCSIILLLAVSCKNSPPQPQKAGHHNAEGNGNNANEDIESGTCNLHLNPAAGSRYYYSIDNESETELEVENKTVTILNKSEIGLTYIIDRDSAGNILLSMQYDKIHLHRKNGDKETDMEAVNDAAATFDPMEKMLSFLKSAIMKVTISPAGKIIGITGYKELGAKIIAGLNTTDLKGKEAAQLQWDKVIGEGMIMKNIDQVFNIFPDRAVHIGDTWKRSNKQYGEISLNVATSYVLKDLDDGKALIKSESEVTSNKGEYNVMGYSVTGDLNGKQDGTFEIEAETGMLLNNKNTGKVTGSLQMMGKEIPVTIKSTVRMIGKKI